MKSGNEDSSVVFGLEVHRTLPASEVSSGRGKDVRWRSFGARGIELTKGKQQEGVRAGVAERNWSDNYQVRRRPASVGEDEAGGGDAVLGAPIDGWRWRRMLTRSRRRKEATEGKLVAGDRNGEGHAGAEEGRGGSGRERDDALVAG